ncbi:RNA-directed DNA polymerase (reverse transcriptase)-related family protein [Striga hermonthica]|uniref:RNA-directed DNA polymerase (Reverse transcriptase)-related family protein n=1 Tax=Striga hermonthica TaxID=68872 RepID=A0A9N7R874_STRHE|nr:RNA-directed DNA polymerase (reverse transcriptase)-related family protein [Striga hermonthica]
MSKKYSGRTGWISLKLDMSKAYDRVEWDFLRAVMDKRGFPSRFSRLILECISTKVFPSLRRAEHLGNLVGMRCSRRSLRISHLLFADDSIIFTKASTSDMGHILSILDHYKAAPGHLINLEKTAITFSPNISAQLQQEIGTRLRIHELQAHDTYLGLPSVVGRNKSRTFASIREKIWKRLKSWDYRFFSSAGKEGLLKSVIQAMPVYFMSLFRFPNSICKQITGLMRKF